MEKDPFINLYEDLMEMKHRRAGTNPKKGLHTRGGSQRSRHLSSPSFFLSASRHRNGRPKGGSDEPAEGSHRPSGGGAFGQHLDRSVLWYNSFRKR